MVLRCKSLQPRRHVVQGSRHAVSFQARGIRLGTVQDLRSGRYVLHALLHVHWHFPDYAPALVERIGRAAFQRLGYLHLSHFIAVLEFRQLTPELAPSGLLALLSVQQELEHASLDGRGRLFNVSIDVLQRFLHVTRTVALALGRWRRLTCPGLGRRLGFR